MNAALLGALILGEVHILERLSAIGIAGTGRSARVVSRSGTTGEIDSSRDGCPVGAGEASSSSGYQQRKTQSDGREAEREKEQTGAG